MALAAFRSVSGLAGRQMIRFSRSYPKLWATNSVKYKHLLNQSSRTLVALCHGPGSFNGHISKTCGWNTCCSIHTENDKSLVEFLSEEIKLETDQKKSLPKFKDFTASTDGSNVILSKKLGDEQISVKFNINHSVNSSEMMDDQSDDAQMVSKPPFTVEIEKGGRTLAVSCVFTEDVADHQGQSQYDDVLEIEEICIHSGEWKDETYAVSASIMDGNLYDHFLNLLRDRGIDDEFVDLLIDYSTNYEHHQYLSFLENLQRFVKQ